MHRGADRSETGGLEGRSNRACLTPDGPWTFYALPPVGLV